MATKILLIEDHADLRENISEILDLYGYKVATAADGLQGLATAVSFMPQIIVSDLNMPGLNGIELLEKLRERDSTKQIPVILTSASFTADIRVEHSSAFAACLAKPYDFELLVACIEKALQSTPD